MKKTFITLLGICILSNIFALDTLSSKISDVTVFLRGAQVFRKTNSIYLKKGITEYVIKDVSPQLNQKQIQATAKGNFMILDVKHQTEYIEPKKVKPQVVPQRIQNEITAIQDSMIFIKFEKEEITSQLKTLNNEKNMLLNNKLMKGGGRSDSLAVLKEAIVFYRKKLNEINGLIHVQKRKQHFLLARESKTKTRLSELQQFNRNVGQPQKPARTRHHVVVTVYAENATKGSISMNYLVPSAGWIPSYDLRADNSKDPMTVTYKGHVYQNSGEDWNKVNLKLSTYNQNCHTSKPSIGIWRLDYKVYNKVTGVSTQFSQNIASNSVPTSNTGYMNLDANEVLESEEKKFIPKKKLSEIQQSFSNVEFKINLPYSVTSDGKQKLIVVSNEKANANFYHYLLPRVNKNGFLLAKIGDWESLNLLPGKANIYFDKTFVGETNIDPAILQDTLELALGRDRGIISTRKKIDEEVKINPISGKKTQTYTFEIVVRNNTSGEINLTLEDQIPTTKNEDIEIKHLSSKDAILYNSTGKLEWKLKMAAGDKKTLRFSYSIKYDKNKILS